MAGAEARLLPIVTAPCAGVAPPNATAAETARIRIPPLRIARIVPRPVPLGTYPKPGNSLAPPLPIWEDRLAKGDGKDAQIDCRGTHPRRDNYPRPGRHGERELPRHQDPRGLPRRG